MVYALYVLGAALTAFFVWVIFEVTHDEIGKARRFNICMFVIFWPIAVGVLVVYATVDYLMARN